MPIFALKSMVKDIVLEDALKDYKEAKGVEQYRLGAQAIYFPGFPGTHYLPFAAVEKVRIRSVGLCATGSCGKQIPAICVRMFYGGEEAYKDFLFEKQKNAQLAEAALRSYSPELEIDCKVEGFWG